MTEAPTIENMATQAAYPKGMTKLKDRVVWAWQLQLECAADARKDDDKEGFASFACCADVLRGTLNATDEQMLEWYLELKMRSAR